MNTLAYLENPYITSVKSFIKLGPAHATQPVEMAKRPGKMLQEFLFVFVATA
jgi:hypothetical protein